MAKLSDLINLAENNSTGCFDNYAQSNSLAFGPDFSVQFTTGQNDLFGAQTLIQGRMNEWAFGQIVEKLNGPNQKWIGEDKYCPDELRQNILNYLATNRQANRLFIRSRKDSIRAILSDEYTVFDNKQLIDLTAQAVQTIGLEPEVHRATIDDQMSAYILFPQIIFHGDSDSGKGNGGLHPAIYIRNSEIGGGSARITGAVYRSICSNGIIFGWNAKDVFSIRHRWISQNSMLILVTEAIATALKMSEDAAKKFVESQEKHLVPTELKSIINNWASVYGLQVETTKSWLDATLIESQSYGRSSDPRLFDVINAATHVAQLRPAQEQEMMERLAGDMLVYPSPRGGRYGQEETSSRQETIF